MSGGGAWEGRQLECVVGGVRCARARVSASHGVWDERKGCVMNDESTSSTLVGGVRGGFARARRQRHRPRHVAGIQRLVVHREPAPLRVTALVGRSQRCAQGRCEGMPPGGVVSYGVVCRNGHDGRGCVGLWLDKQNRGRDVPAAAERRARRCPRRSPRRCWWRCGGLVAGLGRRPWARRGRGSWTQSPRPRPASQRVEGGDGGERCPWW